MEAPEHLLDLIRLVKPRAALFTTYTFSVSHFDAVFLPVLRSVGCQDIGVLVDADEAARCSEESRSRAAGRIYRVAPVVAPGGGVFHPKLTYLAAESGDVLAVGSGNLTASGQSLQLESFDTVSAVAAPSVFVELAEWMESLASLTQGSSPQAAKLLDQTARRARHAYRLNSSNAVVGPLPPPSLVHTLDGTARDALEALFIAEADAAKTVTVLSPFHAPDGGPILRLAKSVDARSLAVGLDGHRKPLVAPFEQGRFKPLLPGRFVVADSHRSNRRLHAKVFVLEAADKTLVMTGSVNATAQSFESTKNVEVSLARWLTDSPYAWKIAEPTGYEATQKSSDFQPSHLLYVDAWLEADRMLHGRLHASAGVPSSVEATISSGDTPIHQVAINVAADGAFVAGPVPAFDTSQATLLTVSTELATASCWLNVHEELDIAAEERERRAAIARVLRGEYAAEDIAEVLRLLSVAAHGMAAGQAGAMRLSGEKDAVGTDNEAFSFMRWESSGRERAGNTLLGRNPYELLRALNRWMNADLAVPQQADLGVATSNGLQQGVQLLGQTDAEQQDAAAVIDPYALLDQLCLAIRVALERRPELEHGAVLAEVVASRAVDRALKQDLRMTPCLSWIDHFSRFAYPTAKENLCAVAVAMACVTACRLEAQELDPQLPVLREAVERFVGGAMPAERWLELCTVGLGRDLYRRVAGAEREAVLAMTARLSAALTLDDSLLTLLRKAAIGLRRTLASEPEAASFPEVVAVLRERSLKRQDLLRGLIDHETIQRAGSGCPFCYRELTDQHLSTLRQKHALVHKVLTCNQILLYSEQGSRLAHGIQELPDA